MSFRKLVLTVSVTTLLTLPQAVSAQIEKGDSQITLQGSISSQITPDASGSASGSLGGSYGYFFTRQLAFRGIAFLSVGDGVDGGTQLSGVYGAGVELNLTGAGQKFVPYLAFDVSTMTGMGDGASATMLGPAVGARAFVSRSTAFDVSVRYDTESSNTSVGTLRTNFGFAVFFGRNRR